MSVEITGDGERGRETDRERGERQTDGYYSLKLFVQAGVIFELSMIDFVGEPLKYSVFPMIGMLIRWEFVGDLLTLSSSDI